MVWRTSAGQNRCGTWLPGPRRFHGVHPGHLRCSSPACPAFACSCAQPYRVGAAAGFALSGASERLIGLAAFSTPCIFDIYGLLFVQPAKARRCIMTTLPARFARLAWMPAVVIELPSA